MTDRQDNQASAYNAEVQNHTLVKEEKLDLNQGGEISIHDLYPRDVPASPSTAEELAIWNSKQQEMMRTNIATWLVRMFGFSLVMTFLILGLAAFNPDADKTFIKDILPLVLTPLTTILAGAVGYYFGASKEN